MNINVSHSNYSLNLVEKMMLINIAFYTIPICPVYHVEGNI